MIAVSTSLCTGLACIKFSVLDGPTVADVIYSYCQTPANIGRKFIVKKKTAEEFTLIFHSFA